MAENIKEYKDRFASPIGGKFTPPKKAKKAGAKKTAAVKSTKKKK